MPNATTGTAPFLLVHEHPPIKPLAILKSSQEDEVVFLQVIGESVADYIQKLKQLVKNVVHHADMVTKNQQIKYVQHQFTVYRHRIFHRR